VTSIAFYTLGCKSNQYETDRMAKIAISLGLELVPYPAKADIYVINTCTVTGNADKKSRNYIRHAKKLNPDAKVIVTGCYVEGGSFNLKEADVILRNKDKFNIDECFRDEKRETRNEIIPSPLPAGRHGISHLSSRVRSNLMIEDGCENFCSYCIVPYVRGKVRSRPIDEIINEAREMVANGVKELVLTGINLGEFPHLPSLISHFSNLDGLLRIRLSSIEPQYVTDELIKIVKEDPKVCKHLHIPMQSGDDRILKMMKRNYSSKGFLSLINRVKKQIKGVAITTDIIIGFPGEDEKAFNNTCRLVNKLQFSRIHIFSYSDRPRTAASKLPEKVDPKIIAKRHEKLGALKDKYMLKFHRSFKRMPMEVLIEQKDRKTGMYEGLTSNYIRVFINSDDWGDDSIGKLLPLKFKDFRGENVFACLPVGTADPVLL